VIPRPIAYHITFGTYGTRLHGDPRGTVDRSHNQPGEPIVGADLTRWEREHAKLRFEPVLMTPEQMRFAEDQLPAICTRGGWTLHTAAAGPDHVHTLLTAAADGEAVRKWLKRWLGEAMSASWRLAPGATWWAECGSVKWVWDERYFARVFDYVRDQRAAR
jgi:REP element-mobilizing transposase RayT